MMNQRTFMRCFVILLATISCAANTFNQLADVIIRQLLEMTGLIAQMSFIAGLGFLVATIFKFKQFKDNPTQQPIGNPLMMFVISILLMFLGNLIVPSGETLFGGSPALVRDTDSTDSRRRGYGIEVL